MSANCCPERKTIPLRTLRGRLAKSPVHQRPLLEVSQAHHLEKIFSILANVTRLRILHCLIRSPDSGVTQITDALGMKISAVSNQLQKLADQGILAATREGQMIRYQIIDPCVPELLEIGWCLAEDSHLGRRGYQQNPDRPFGSVRTALFGPS